MQLEGNDYLLWAHKTDRVHNLNEEQIKMGLPFFLECSLNAKLTCFWLDKIMALPDMNLLEKGVIEKLVKDYRDKTFFEKQFLGIYILDNIDFDNHLLLAIPWDEILEFTDEDGINHLLYVMEKVKKNNYDLFQLVLDQQEEVEFIETLQDTIDDNDYNFVIEDLYDLDGD